MKKLSVILFLFLIPGMSFASHIFHAVGSLDYRKSWPVEWTMYWCPVHKKLFYFDHFAQYEHCYKKSRKWHKKHKEEFIHGDAPLSASVK